MFTVIGTYTKDAAVIIKNELFADEYFPSLNNTQTHLAITWQNEWSYIYNYTIGIRKQFMLS